VLREDRVGDVGPPYIPDVYRKVPDKTRATGDMVVMLGPPFDPTHRSNCVDQVFKFGIGRVPDLDLFQTLEDIISLIWEDHKVIALGANKKLFL
jgi:hypothetical protein